VNQGIKRLNITDNNIADYHLKGLLAMLINNQYIEEIEYTTTQKENLQKRTEFRKYVEAGKTAG